MAAPTVHVHLLARVGMPATGGCSATSRRDTRQPAADNRLPAVVAAYDRRRRPSARRNRREDDRDASRPSLERRQRRRLREPVSPVFGLRFDRIGERMGRRPPTRRRSTPASARAAAARSGMRSSTADSRSISSRLGRVKSAAPALAQSSPRPCDEGERAPCASPAPRTPAQLDVRPPLALELSADRACSAPPPDRAARARARRARRARARSIRRRSLKRGARQSDLVARAPQRPAHRASRRGSRPR